MMIATEVVGGEVKKEAAMLWPTQHWDVEWHSSVDGKPGTGHKARITRIDPQGILDLIVTNPRGGDYIKKSVHHKSSKFFVTNPHMRASEDGCWDWLIEQPKELLELVLGMREPEPEPKPLKEQLLELLRADTEFAKELKGLINAK